MIFHINFNKFLTRYKRLDQNRVNSYSPRALREPIYPEGGHMAPYPKIPWTCQVGLKNGRISKGGLNITLNPTKSHPRYSRESFHLPGSSGCLRDNLKMSRRTALRHDFARILEDFCYPASTKPA